MSTPSAFKYLTLIRHGDAQTPHMVKIDRDRALSGAGMKQIETLRNKAHSNFLNVDCVLCSNARRTRQTLEGLRRSIPERAHISFEDRLYGASVQFLMERIRRMEDRYQHVLIVGHNPTLQDFTTSVRQSPHNTDFNILPTNPGTALFLKAELTSWFQADFGSFDILDQYSPS